METNQDNLQPTENDSSKFDRNCCPSSDEIQFEASPSSLSGPEVPENMEVESVNIDELNLNGSLEEAKDNFKDTNDVNDGMRKRLKGSDIPDPPIHDSKVTKNTPENPNRKKSSKLYEPLTLGIFAVVLLGILCAFASNIKVSNEANQELLDKISSLEKALSQQNKKQEKEIIALRNENKKLHSEITSNFNSRVVKDRNLDNKLKEIATLQEENRRLAEIYGFTTCNNALNPANRTDCGWSGIDARKCRDMGCCWDHTRSGDGMYYCYIPPAGEYSAGLDYCEFSNPINNRIVNCGHDGITQNECETKGCCFDSRVPGAYNCFGRNKKPAKPPLKKKAETFKTTGSTQL